MKKILKIILLSLGVVIFLCGCSKLFEKNSSENMKDSADKKVLSVEEIKNIKLEEMSSNIKIYYHNDQNMLIKNENVNDFSYEIKDSTLVIAPGRNANNGDYTIFLPRKDYNEIKIINKNASTKVFDINAFTLEIHSNDEVVVDSTKIDYLRAWTENSKVVLTKSEFKDMNTATEDEGKIVVDKVKVGEVALLKTEDGDILANFIGNKNDYKVLQDFDVNNEYNKKIITLTKNGNIDVKFI